MENQFDILKKNRALVLKLIDGFTIDQLNKTPEGFTNNIAWNVAHLVVTQQLLCYKFSSLPLYVSQEMVEAYMKGSAPSRDITQEEFDEIIKLYKELPEKIEEDYNKGIFKSYAEYTTSVNVTLDSVEKAIDFNNFHEGIHLGVILALRKLV